MVMPPVAPVLMPWAVEIRVLIFETDLVAQKADVGTEQRFQRVQHSRIGDGLMKQLAALRKSDADAGGEKRFRVAPLRFRLGGDLLDDALAFGFEPVRFVSVKKMRDDGESVALKVVGKCAGVHGFVP